VQLRIEAQFEDLGSNIARSVPWASLSREPAVVHDDQPVAQLLGLVHVVRGQINVTHAA